MKNIHTFKPSEEKKMNKLDKYVKKYAGDLPTTSHIRNGIELKFFIKLFGERSSEGESKKLRDWRFNLIMYNYKFAVKDKKCAPNVKMEQWCREWDSYSKEDLSETCWLMENIMNGKLSYRDAISGNYKSPYHKNVQVPSDPPQIIIYE